MSYQVFDNGDDEYFDWMEQHLDGFILNVSKYPSDPIFMHRVTCWTVGRNSGRNEGSFTTNTQFKVVATMVECLNQWYDDYEPKTEIKYCLKCNPI